MKRKMNYGSAAAAGLFAAAVVVNLFACYSGDSALAARSKPFLMPLLCLTGILIMDGPLLWKVLLGFALGFHTSGDVLLLFPGQKWFLLGMGAFLVGHVFYLALFRRLGVYKGISRWQWIGGFAGVAIAVAVLVMTIGVKGAMGPAVAVYGFVLLCLTLSGIYGKMPLVIAGGLLFAFSDSLIALRSFAHIRLFAHTGFAIMLTYIAAQILLVAGILRRGRMVPWQRQQPDGKESLSA